MKTFLGLFTSNLRLLVDDKIRGGDVSFFKTHGNFLQKCWQYIVGGTNKTGVVVVGCFEALWTVIRYLLIALAVFFLCWSCQWKLLYFLSSYIGYFAMITGHDGCARFRMLFEFVLIILAAYGLWIVYRFVASKRKTINYE